MLNPILVSSDQLLLDPNNPRLARNFGFDGNIPIGKCAELQSDIEKLFNVPVEKTAQEETDELLNDDDELQSDDFFAIDELKESIRNIGFVVIQNIVVRSVPNSDKYIVIEGNRRVASIKAVLREHQKALPGDVKWRIEDESILKSEEWNIRGYDAIVPYYNFDKCKVWGATAAILSEFKWILKEIMN